MQALQKFVADLQASHDDLRRGRKVDLEEQQSILQGAHENLEKQLRKEIQHYGDELRAHESELETRLAGERVAREEQRAALNHSLEHLDRELRRSLSGDRFVQQLAGEQAARGCLEAELSQRLHEMERLIRAQVSKLSDAHTELHAGMEEQRAEQKKALAEIVAQLRGEMTQNSRCVDVSNALDEQIVVFEGRHANLSSELATVNRELRRELQAMTLSSAENLRVQGSQMREKLEEFLAQFAEVAAGQETMQARIKNLETPTESKMSAFISREDLDADLHRVWQALDTHTHQVTETQKHQPNEILVKEETTTQHVAPQQVVLEEIITPQVVAPQQIVVKEHIVSPRIAAPQQILVKEEVVSVAPKGSFRQAISPPGSIIMAGSPLPLLSTSVRATPGVPRLISTGSPLTTQVMTPPASARMRG